MCALVLKAGVAGAGVDTAEAAPPLARGAADDEGAPTCSEVWEEVEQMEDELGRRAMGAGAGVHAAEVMLPLQASALTAHSMEARDAAAVLEA